MNEIEELRKQIRELQEKLRSVTGEAIVVGRAKLDKSPTYDGAWRLAFHNETNNTGTIKRVITKKWVNLAQGDRSAVIEEIPILIRDMQKLYDTAKGEKHDEA